MNLRIVRSLKPRLKFKDRFFTSSEETKFGISLARLEFEQSDNNDVSLESLISSKHLTVQKALSIVKSLAPKETFRVSRAYIGDLIAQNFQLLSLKEEKELITALRNEIGLRVFEEDDVVVFGERPMFISFTDFAGGSSSYETQEVDYPNAIVRSGDMVDEVIFRGEPVVRQVTVPGIPDHATSLKVTKGLSKKDRYGEKPEHSFFFALKCKFKKAPSIPQRRGFGGCFG